MAKLGPHWSAISAQLASDVRAAWPDVVNVFLDYPEVQSEGLPYAAVVLDGVDMAYGTVGTVHQVWRVSIYGVFKRPGAGYLRTDHLMDRYDSLSLQLEAAECYAGVGFLPLIERFDPDESFDSREGAVTFRVVFRFTTERSFGT